VALHEEHRWFGDVVRSELSALPFLENSIDLAILPHVLEFEKSPQEVLQEVAYALIPRGYIIIFGFNPYSLWGMNAKFSRKKNKPWHGEFICINKIRNWLNQCDCEIDFYKTFCFEIPCENTKLREKLNFIKSLGQTCWPTNGAVYCLIARKEVATLTPIKMPWRMQQVNFSKKRITEPTSSTRTIMRNPRDKTS
jgi:SAM-dependent methyltransferase